MSVMRRLGDAILLGLIHIQRRHQRNDVACHQCTRRTERVLRVTHKTKNVQIYAQFILLQHPLHAGARHLHTHATQTETNDIVRSTAKGSYMSSATKTHT